MDAIALVRKGTRNPLYRAWTNMRSRCRNSKSYIERGITVDPSWEDFEAFAKDMFPRPDGMTLERVDNDKGYSRGNCVWASADVQANNRSNNRKVRFGNEVKNVSQWARAFGVKPQTVFVRIHKGWPVEKALLTATREAA